MREIKFRVRDIEGKCWIPIGSWVIDSEGILCTWDRVEKRYIQESIKYSLQQFTGLKDKNGIEIFEGDIVAKGHYRYGLNPHNIKIGIVIYKSPSFELDKQFIPKPPDDGCSGCPYDINEALNSISSRGENILEVIGNIHENPELLEPRTQA